MNLTPVMIAALLLSPKSIVRDASALERLEKMSELKMGIGKSDEWYTPPEIFEALKVNFDLDPCGSDSDDFVPASLKYMKCHDGLSKNWLGKFVWMNPPFGGRNGHVPWLKKFIENGNGIGLCRAYTSAGWFHEYMPQMDCILFPKGKTKFIDQNGQRGKSPSSGIVMFALGEKGSRALKECNLGMFFMTKHYPDRRAALRSQEITGGAIADIAAERKRQIEKEGWSIEHDDDHDDGSLAKAAGCYALHAGGVKDIVGKLEDHGTGVRGRTLEKIPRHWPWSAAWWKPKRNPRKDLVRAGALIVAEIERLDRATPQPAASEGKDHE
jgi:hypothetical protein